MKPLQRIRISQFMTPQEVAEKVGTTEEDYRRWEVEGEPVPSQFLKRLAKAFEVTVDELLGKPKPFDMSATSKTIGANRQYFGEVAVHFPSGKNPLLLPISVAQRHTIYQQMNNPDRSIIAIESLDNRTVLIPRAAIADMYLSSDAYDTFGPEDRDYYGYLGVYPDDEFWRIVADAGEDLASEEVPDEFDPAYVTQVLGFMSEMDDEGRDRFIARTQNITWQLRSGVLREALVDLDESLFGAVASFGDLDDEAATHFEDHFHVSAEGYHRSIFINIDQAEWISIPSHRLHEAELAESRVLLEEKEVSERQTQHAGR